MGGWMVLAVAVITACLLFSPPAYATQQSHEVHTITLIRGLDDGAYEPYSATLIEKVQTALKGLNLYQGEVNGELDEATMKAIGEFQKAHELMVSGVPSPATRKLLLEE